MREISAPAAELLADGVDLESIYLSLAGAAVARQFDHEMEIWANHQAARKRHEAKRADIHAVFRRREAERRALEGMH